MEITKADTLTAKKCMKRCPTYQTSISIFLNSFTYFFCFTLFCYGKDDYSPHMLNFGFEFLCSYKLFPYIVFHSKFRSLHLLPFLLVLFTQGYLNEGTESHGFFGNLMLVDFFSNI